MTLTALRMLARDWRGGELGVLLSALMLAVGVVAGISAFTTRLSTALEQESHRFLAADLIVSAGSELPAQWLDDASSRGLATARTLHFPSIIYAGEEAMHLASVKAVTGDYPLRGDLLVAKEAYGEPVVASTGPTTKKVWLNSRLFSLLQ